MPAFYDTHAHLDYPDFAQDLPQVIERAQAAGIAKIISIGTDLDSSRRAIELSERFPCVFAVVGWHPTHVLEAPEDLPPALRELARHPKVVAIGETGFDYHRAHRGGLPVDRGARAVGRGGVAELIVGRHDDARLGAAADDERYQRKQAQIFEQQLEVAAESGLNCVVHQRDALEDTIALMEKFAGRASGVFHCFANDAAAIQRIVAMGSLVSFTGIATFKNGQNVRDTLAATPLDKLMLETDCPFLAPLPYRGKRCEPAYVKEISQLAAQVKGCSLEELSHATCATAQRFFPKLS